MVAKYILAPQNKVVRGGAGEEESKASIEQNKVSVTINLGDNTKRVCYDYQLVNPEEKKDYEDTKDNYVFYKANLTGKNQPAKLNML